MLNKLQYILEIGQQNEQIFAHKNFKKKKKLKMKLK